MSELKKKFSEKITVNVFISNVCQQIKKFIKKKFFCKINLLPRTHRERFESVFFSSLKKGWEFQFVNSNSSDCLFVWILFSDFVFFWIQEKNQKNWILFCFVWLILLLFGFREILFWPFVFEAFLYFDKFDSFKILFFVPLSVNHVLHSSSIQFLCYDFNSNWLIWLI